MSYRVVFALPPNGEPPVRPYRSFATVADARAYAMQWEGTYGDRSNHFEIEGVDGSMCETWTRTNGDWEKLGGA